MEGDSEKCVSFFFSSPFNNVTEDISEELDRLELKNSIYDKELYEICVAVERNIRQKEQMSHLEQNIKAFKRSRDLTHMDFNGNSKRQKCKEEIPESLAGHIQSEETTFRTCHQTMGQDCFGHYFKEMGYKEGDSSANVSVVDAVISQRHIKYRIDGEKDPAPDCVDSSSIFLDSIGHIIKALVIQCINEYVILQVQFLLHIEYRDECEINLKNFTVYTPSYVIGSDYKLSVFLKFLCDDLNIEIRNFDRMHSDWVYKRFKYLEMTVVAPVKKLNSCYYNVAM